MFKQIVLGTVLTAFACLAEEQAPVTPTARVEVLAVRVVQFFNTFDVEVHRAVMTKNAAGSVGDLKVVGKVAVSGYPEKWKKSAADADLAASRRSFSALLDGKLIELPVQSQAQLAARVVVQEGGEVRVLGLFTQGAPAGTNLEAFCVPFDFTVLPGERTVVCQRTSALLPEVAGPFPPQEAPPTDEADKNQ
ncbi:hypothetical protein [Pontiella sulfatireligans]|uniref:Uncharacterized protein n=1 Tax=Pontiella sulfatireligans TaxID=2750658 RepID=A0A6C2UMF5_9BACT|nr:hypothetical protein [Pontiella sulfatireligans]VGO20296.1 hypothetical protein SCARR_02358 [Pontiella sulfatireligans]